MERSIITTADGANTIHLHQWNEQYHSKHGAIQEALHVYLKAGYHTFLERSPKAKSLSILEIGFGTGLNTLLTLMKALDSSVKIDYQSVEAYPISKAEWEMLNYPLLIKNSSAYFKEIHNCSWGQPHLLNANFCLTKRHQLISEIKDTNAFDVIYFDAFGPRVQPDLWTPKVFKSMYQALKKSGILVTYSAKGSVRRAMIESGFEVERLQGPKGKREMLRATKHD